jgi:hypothetical protein
MVKIGTQDVEGKISGGRLTPMLPNSPEFILEIVLEHTYEYNAKIE